MATINETMWVHDKSELDNTVQNLIARGGVVQYQADDAVTLFIKKKINVPVLVVGLILCLVPGLVYLIWYMTDKDQQMMVRIGQPGQIAHNAGAGEHTHWYEQDAVDGAAPGTSPRNDVINNSTDAATTAAVPPTSTTGVPPVMPPAAEPTVAPPPPAQPPAAAPPATPPAPPPPPAT